MRFGSVGGRRRGALAARGGSRPDAPYEVLTARSAAGSSQVLEREDVQVVVSRRWMPRNAGVKLLAELAKRVPHIVRILLTGDPQLDAAVRAIFSTG